MTSDQTPSLSKRADAIEAEAVRNPPAPHPWQPFNVGNDICAVAGCRLSAADHHARLAAGTEEG